MSCYDLKGLLGVPGGFYRILTTPKGVWRILEVGEFVSGRLMSSEVLEGRKVPGWSSKSFWRL